MFPKYLIILISSILAFHSFPCLAQHIDIDKKKLAFLTFEENMNIQFSFKDVRIDESGESAFKKHIFEKITRLENSEKAEIWITSYDENKLRVWPKAFTTTLNEKIASYGHSPLFVENSSAKYTMEVNTTWMYFGYDASIVAKPARVTMDVKFFETQNPEIILFTTTINRADGIYNKEDGDGEGTGPSLNRMRKAFITAGYKFGQALKRVLD